MATLFLIIIYLAFISLGLPDSLLGAAWPMMRLDLGMQLSAAGLISMLISCGTITSSFLSGRVTKRFGTGKVTSVSVLMTAFSLIGFALSPSYIWFCILALPLGLGAGAVDAALNNFVALHYEAKHMSWLHCFWGVGATAGPLIMSGFLGRASGWRMGYGVIGGIQVVLVIVLFVTLPFWKQFNQATGQEVEGRKSEKEVTNVYVIKGVKAALFSFFFYCAIEMTSGLWGSSYLVNTRGATVEQGAGWVSLFYLGITIGRFLSGVVAMKLKNQILIRLGEGILFLGIIALLLPIDRNICMVGFLLIGLGSAPIFPCMIHETPMRFGSHLSQTLIGIQMAFAYIGTLVMPPIFGFIANKINTALFPFYLLILFLLMVICTEKANVKYQN